MIEQAYNVMVSPDLPGGLRHYDIRVSAESGAAACRRGLDIFLDRVKAGRYSAWSLAELIGRSIWVNARPINGKERSFLRATIGISVTTLEETEEPRP